MIEFFIVTAFISIMILLIYSPAIYHYVLFLYYDKKFHQELQALEDSGFFDKCRLVVTKPLGLGPEPAGTISFADVMKNQEFAIKSTIALMSELEG